MPKIEPVGEGQAVPLDQLPEVLGRARLRLAGEIEWRFFGGRERAWSWSPIRRRPLRSPAG